MEGGRGGGRDPYLQRVRKDQWLARMETWTHTHALAWACGAHCRCERQPEDPSGGIRLRYGGGNGVGDHHILEYYHV